MTDKPIYKFVRHELVPDCRKLKKNCNRYSREIEITIQLIAIFPDWGDWIFRQLEDGTGGTNRTSPTNSVSL